MMKTVLKVVVFLGIISSVVVVGASGKVKSKRETTVKKAVLMADDNRNETVGTMVATVGYTAVSVESLDIKLNVGKLEPETGYEGKAIFYYNETDCRSVVGLKLLTITDGKGSCHVVYLDSRGTPPTARPRYLRCFLHKMDTLGGMLYDTGLVPIFD